jgi:hypothetical protein
MARNATPVSKDHVTDATGAQAPAEAGTASTAPPAPDGGAPVVQGPAIATLNGLRPPMSDQELKDMTKISVAIPRNGDSYPIPEQDVYARDGMLSTDPRARRAGMQSVQILESRDGKVTKTAKHIDAPVAVKRYRVTADAQVVGPGGMPMLIRAGKVVSESTHDLARLKQFGVKLEEI